MKDWELTLLSRLPNSQALIVSAVRKASLIDFRTRAVKNPLTVLQGHIPQLNMGHEQQTLRESREEHVSIPQAEGGIKVLAIHAVSWMIMENIPFKLI